MTLALNMLTGVIVARVLGADGRGALTAIITAPPVLGWILGMGCGKAVTFFLTRNPTLGAKLFSTWLAIMVPIAVVAVTIGEIALPTLLSAQSAQTLSLARLYMPTIILVLLSDLLLGLVLGEQQFLFFNILRFAQPAGAAAAYIALWLTGFFSLESAIATQAVTAFGVVAAATIHVVHTHGLAWPDLKIGKSTFWYALRTHGEIISGTITQRLDLLIVPAFLAASRVGFYAIATNTSWIIVTVSGALATILLPAAVHRGESGRALVIKSLHTTLIIGVVLGGGLFLLADPVIRIVYGEGFAESVLPMRILLPGAIVYAAASVLINGLYAENRPFMATIAQVVGMVVTLVGLLAFLRPGGILAAAIVSTVAYGLVFAAAGILYRNVTGLSWRAFALGPSDFQEPLRRLFAILRPAPQRVSEAAGPREIGE
jgi:O-antigen/teichoic acid export membrane protein